MRNTCVFIKVNITSELDLVFHVSRENEVVGPHLKVVWLGKDKYAGHSEGKKKR